jgi:hypothetical protein
VLKSAPATDAMIVETVRLMHTTAFRAWRAASAASHLRSSRTRPDS